MLFIFKDLSKQNYVHLTINFTMTANVGVVNVVFTYLRAIMTARGPYRISLLTGALTSLCNGEEAMGTKSR